MSYFAMLPLTKADNMIFVDLENTDSIKSFLSALSNKKQIILEKFISEASSPIKDKRCIAQ
jgi:hypothetical protein